MKRLHEAWKLINEATKEEKAELFADFIADIKENEEALQRPDNRFSMHRSNAIQASDKLTGFVRHLTKYDVRWIPDEYAKHIYKAGRREKYSDVSREVNCFFIAHMVKYEASETQAMKLLLRLRGDLSMSEGHFRELRDTYRDYKAIGRPSEGDMNILFNGWIIAEFLEFSIDQLESEEKASLVAVAAFRKFMADLVILMKGMHSTIAQADVSYPGLFGNLISWLSEDYSDPLDYFYTHSSHETDLPELRKQWLREYINTIYHFSN